MQWVLSAWNFDPWVIGGLLGAGALYARGWSTRPGLGRVWHALTGPVVVWCVLAVTLWIWHLPGPYQAAVLHPGVHRLEHGTIVGASLLFWWVVIQPVGRRRIDGGSAVLLIFAAKVQTGTLGALLTFVPRPMYPVYEAAAAGSGLTPLQDQLTPLRRRRRPDRTRPVPRRA